MEREAKKIWGIRKSRFQTAESAASGPEGLRPGGRTQRKSYKMNPLSLRSLRARRWILIYYDFVTIDGMERKAQGGALIKHPAMLPLAAVSRIYLAAFSPSGSTIFPSATDSGYTIMRLPGARH
jgi:hypothetical protein